jgi:colicin import membrane protein
VAEVKSAHENRIQSQKNEEELKLQSLHGRIKELETALEEKDLVLSKMKESAADSEKQDMRASTAASVSNDEVEILRKQMTEIETDREAIKVALEAEKSKLSQMQTENKEIASKEKQVREKADMTEKQLLEEKSKLQQELSEVKSRLVMKETEVNEMKAKTDAAIKKEQDMAKDIALKEREAQDEKKRADAEAKDKQSKVAAFEIKERELQTKLKETETQLQSKKEESAAARAEADLLKTMNSTAQNKPSSSCSIQ